MHQVAGLSARPTGCTWKLSVIGNKMKKLVKFSFYLFVLISLSFCSEKKSEDEREILSLIYNSQIGDQEHFGSPPPVPPLPPDFDKLSKYESKAEARQELLSSEWKEYFAEDSSYESRVQEWKRRMKALPRKILFHTGTQISEHHREIISRSLGTKYDLHFLEVSKNWKLSDIENRGNYEILDLADYGEIKIDTMHVGLMQFSDIDFSDNRDTAIL